MASAPTSDSSSSTTKKPLRISAGLRRLYGYVFLNLPAAVSRFLSSIVAHEIELVRTCALVKLFRRLNSLPGFTFDIMRRPSIDTSAHLSRNKSLDERPS
jgi:hypothetical protein